MDVIAVRIVILLWLVRPQDWITGFAGFGFMQYAMIAGMLGVYYRPGGFKLGQLFRSPSDWILVAYLLWILYTTGNWFNTAKALVPLAAFYYTTALALNTRERLASFLTCWVVGLGIVSIFALSAHFGFELAAGSLALTQIFEGRLTLNTWIYNNPNALGHGVVALIPLAFIWLVWKRSPGIKLLGIVLMSLAAYCVYLTESKGAYLCGAGAMTLLLIFRRPKGVQIGVLILVMTAGVGALKMLPRMETMNAKEDGIAGRLLIWQMAYNAMKNTQVGEGWKQFEAWIDTPDYGLLRKATHGSYVNVGADLGYPGLFLFVGLLYVGARTLVQSRPDPEDVMMQRCQRALYALLLCFSASAWMIDRAYHTDYFLIAGAIAAFHRLMTLPPAELAQVPKEEPAQPEQDDLQPVPGLAWANLAGPQPAFAGAGAMPVASAKMGWPLREAADSGGGSPSLEAEDAPGTEPAPYGWLKWRRLQFLDFVLMTAAFTAVLIVWEKMMTDFISF